MYPISQVTGPVVYDIQYVKLNVCFTNGTTTTTRYFAFSNSFRQETIGGIEYDRLSALMAVSNQQDDLTTTGAETTVTITGMDPYYQYIVAGAPATAPIPCSNGQDPIPVGYYPLIKGSQVVIGFAFYDANYNLVNSIVSYTGIITNYNITEVRDATVEFVDNTYTIGLLTAPIRKTLENRYAGRKTVAAGMRQWFPTDSSMDQVAALSMTSFDFGYPASGTYASQLSSVQQNLSNNA